MIPTVISREHNFYMKVADVRQKEDRVPNDMI